MTSSKHGTGQWKSSRNFFWASSNLRFFSISISKGLYILAPWQRVEERSNCKVYVRGRLQHQTFAMTWTIHGTEKNALKQLHRQRFVMRSQRRMPWNKRTQIFQSEIWYADTESKWRDRSEHSLTIAVEILTFFLSFFLVLPHWTRQGPGEELPHFWNWQDRRLHSHDNREEENCKLQPWIITTTSGMSDAWIVIQRQTPQDSSWTSE